MTYTYVYILFFVYFNFFFTHFVDQWCNFITRSLTPSLTYSLTQPHLHLKLLQSSQKQTGLTDYIRNTEPKVQPQCSKNEYTSDLQG